jgi:hypothetical protein
VPQDAECEAISRLMPPVLQIPEVLIMPGTFARSRAERNCRYRFIVAVDAAAKKKKSVEIVVQKACGNWHVRDFADRLDQKPRGFDMPINLIKRLFPEF